MSDGVDKIVGGRGVTRTRTRVVKSHSRMWPGCPYKAVCLGFWYGVGFCVMVVPLIYWFWNYAQ